MTLKAWSISLSLQTVLSSNCFIFSNISTDFTFGPLFQRSEEVILETFKFDPTWNDVAQFISSYDFLIYIFAFFSIVLRRSVRLRWLSSGITLFFTFLCPDERFDVMTYFWRNDKLFHVLTYYWHHCELFDVMTCFWCHDMFLMLWHVFDVMTNLFSS